MVRSCGEVLATNEGRKRAHIERPNPDRVAAWLESVRRATAAMAAMSRRKLDLLFAYGIAFGHARDDADRLALDPGQGFGVGEEVSVAVSWRSVLPSLFCDELLSWLLLEDWSVCTWTVG